MSIVKKAVRLLVAAMVISGGGFAEAQISISKDKSGKTRTFLAGQLSVGHDIASVENKSFVCTVLKSLKKGDTIAAMTSEDQAWSIQKESMEVGKQKESFSVMAMAKGKDGAFHAFFPAWIEFKLDVAAGKTIHTNGFQIQATRSIKAGNRIPVILVDMSSMLSIEPVEEVKDSNTTLLPWLIVHEEDLNADKRSALIDIWRTATEHIRK